MSERVRYFVDEKRKIVTAVLSDTEYDAIDAVECMAGKAFSNLATLYYKGRIITDAQVKYLIPNRFVGVAHCTDPDVFDVEVGKQLALDKMNKKYYAAKSKAIKNILKSIENAFEEFKFRCNNSADMYRTRAVNCDNRIIDMINNGVESKDSSLFNKIFNK